MLHASRRLRRAAFTLIELLVVIAIIGMLASMILGGISVIRAAAKKKMARTEAMSIVAAMKEYRGDFFQWPGQTKFNSTADRICVSDSDVAAVLKPLTENSKKHNYIEIREGAEVNGAYYDPWDVAYVIGLDYNNDGKVSLNLTGMTTNVFDTVAVISIGNDPGNPQSGVFSW